MFKPSTVLIQSDVNGGNNNLFDAVQDYLTQSYNKKKNSIHKKFPTEDENESKNEIENKIEKKIDNSQVDLNKNKKSKILSRSILTRYREKIEHKTKKNDDSKIMSVQSDDDDSNRNEQKFENLTSKDLGVSCEKRINEEDEKEDFKSVSTELYLIHRYVTILHLTSLFSVLYCFVLF
jgi:hypothetical protein